MGEVTDGPSRLRIRALQALGGHCVCCFDGRFEFLQIDHVAGVGYGRIDRKLFRRKGDTWLRRVSAGLESGKLRVLCASCHYSKTQYGYCPHEREE